MGIFYQNKQRLHDDARQILELSDGQDIDYHIVKLFFDPDIVALLV